MGRVDRNPQGMEVWYMVRCYGGERESCGKTASVQRGWNSTAGGARHFRSLGWSKTKDGWRCPDHASKQGKKETP